MGLSYLKLDVSFNKKCTDRFEHKSVQKGTLDGRTIAVQMLIMIC